LEEQAMERQHADTPTAHEQMGRTIVCLYSQADELFYLQLKKSLNLWERQRQVRWLEVLPGDEPATTWQRDVQRADLILLLLSPDFFPDDLCYHTMHLALQERAARQVSVVPVLIRAVDWRASACKDLAVVPCNEQPVASWTSRDEAFASIGADLARLLPAWGLLVPPRSMVFRVPDLPEGYVPRPEAFQEIKRILLEKRMGQTTAITTALRGAGGFGKTTLAMALCHDSDIQAAFPEILWVELGEQPPRALDLLNRLLAFLEGSHTEAITLQEARERWHVALRDRVCLLVIDDVWQEEALSPFLRGGPQCMRLVTTRNDLLLPKDAARILIDTMNQHEAVALLCQDKDLPDEISQTRYQPRLEALAARLGRWPLLLTLARGMFTDLVVAYHLSIAEALTTIAEMYQTRGVTAFRLENVEERQRTVDACLRVSVQHLETFTPPHYYAIERYQELAVFPEDTDIPLAALQTYWKGSAGLEPWETKDLCTRLHRLSLLLTCDLGRGTIRLHDVLRSYLIQSAGSHLPALHARLLDAYQQVLGVTRWANLPQSEAYLWQRLVYHLCQADHQEALQTTLTDLLYVTRTVLYLGVSALEADLALVNTSSKQKEGNTQATSLFASLHRTIMQISHLLRRVSTEAEIGGLLLSHLQEEKRLTIPCLALEQTLPRPFLGDWHPLTHTSSDISLSPLARRTHSVNACAFSPDGRWIVSADSDRTLKMWEAATGALVRALSSHTRPVSGCAFSPDGLFIVSASWDHTLKVWEAATGTELHTLCGHSWSVNDCAFSPDGRWIVSASTDWTLTVWKASTGTLVRTLYGHTDQVNGCAFSPDGKWIVSASADRMLKVWEAATGTERLTLRGHRNSVSACAFSPDGRFIVSASYDQTLKVWEAATGALVRTLSGHTDWVRACVFSPNGRTIISASWDSTLKVWEGQTGQQVLTFPVDGQLSGCAFHPDGMHLVAWGTLGIYFLRLVV